MLATQTSGPPYDSDSSTATYSSHTSTPGTVTSTSGSSKVKKLKVMVKKLDMVKYGQYPNPETESEFDVDKEIKTEEDIDPLALDNYDKENETTSIDIIDPLTKIEIEEDLILKTESSDSSHFSEQCHTK